MLHISEEAAEWYKRELGVSEGEAIRFFARYSAGGHIHPGFSLGIEVRKPVSPGLLTTVQGIIFYMEDQDLWYLDGYHLKVEHDPQEDDIHYRYVQ